MDTGNDAPATKPARTPAERELLAAMAMALWSAETMGDKSTPKGAFKEVRADYVKRASRLLKQMNRRGLSLTLAAPAAQGDA